jgi:Na+/alanine symporter
MGPGGIATIIAASSLAIIALAIGYFIIRATRVIDELQKTIASVNRIATTAENFTEKLSGLVSNLTTMNTGLSKVISSAASLIPGVASFTARKGNKSEQKEQH